MKSSFLRLAVHLSLLAVLPAGGRQAAAQTKHPADETRFEIHVQWSPPESRAKSILVTGFDGDTPILEDILTVADDAVQVRTINPRLTRLVLRTPLHAACDMSLVEPHDTPCVLNELVHIWPFGKDHPGRLWTRGSQPPGVPLTEAPPVPGDWGGGFALPAGRYDAVLAPKGRPAQLLLGVDANGIRSPMQEPTGEHAYRLRARVLGPSGAPLPDCCQITTDPGDSADPNRRRRLETWAAFLKANPPRWDKTGTFEIEPWSADSPTLRIAAGALAPLRVVPRGRAERGTLDLGTLQFASSTNLLVAVRLNSAGLALSTNLDVEVRFLRQAPGFSKPGELTLRQNLDDKGQARFVVPTPGEWRITVRSSGTAFGERTVLVEGPAMTAEIEFREVGVEGNVRSSRGKPVTDCEVGVKSPRGEGYRSSTRCDDNGEFQVRFLHAGGDVLVVARRLSDGAFADKQIDPSSETSVRLVVRESGLRVRVTEASTGVPVAGAQVYLLGQGEILVRGQRERAEFNSWENTDGEGRAAFRSIDDGDYGVEVTAPGFRRWRSEHLFSVKNAEQQEERAISLERSSRQKGLVTDAAGNGIGGAVLARLDSVRMGRPDDLPSDLTRCDGEGRFEVELGEAGTPVAVWAAGFRLDLAFLSPSENELRLVLLPRGEDSAIEFFTDDGRPIKNVLWGLSRDGLRLPRELLYTAFGASGCVYEPADANGTVLVGGCLSSASYSVFITISRQGKFVDVPAGTVDLPGNRLTRFVISRPK